MAIPIILIFVIIVQNQKLHLHTFNRVLPLICIALFVGVWTQKSLPVATVSGTEESTFALKHVSENLFFYIKQSILPLTVSLFHPAETNKGFNVGASMSLLPFLLFFPFYILGAINFRKPWARAGLLGITAFFFFSLNGITQDGIFLSGERAYETFGLYTALPFAIALVFCGLGQAVRFIGTTGRFFGTITFSIFFMIHIAVTTLAVQTVGKPVNMWQSMSRQWPKSSTTKIAFINSVITSGSDVIGEEERIDLLNEILDAQPDRVEERKVLARSYSNAGQNTNAVREYRRVLRETNPEDDFLEEAAKLFEKLGLSRDARNARDRKTE